MTTEDDFQRKLDAHPEDWQTRLVFADWLDERGDPRAEGMRALGLHRMHPCDLCNPPRWVFWNGKEYGARSQGYYLSGDWFRLIAGRGETLWARFKTRRKADDAAALAFAKLPAARRAELLSVVGVA
jgi:uncharacterized protein (TIGR02996 family)